MVRRRDNCAQAADDHQPPAVAQQRWQELVGDGNKSEHVNFVLPLHLKQGHAVPS